jgi:CHAT domain-containing protein/Tfp pilus assembly protein PilF
LIQLAEGFGGGRVRAGGGGQTECVTLGANRIRGASGAAITNSETPQGARFKGAIAGGVTGRPESFQQGDRVGCSPGRKRFGGLGLERVGHRLLCPDRAADEGEKEKAAKDHGGLVFHIAQSGAIWEDARTVRLPPRSVSAVIGVAILGLIAAGVSVWAQPAAPPMTAAEAKATLDRGVQLRTRSNPIAAKPLLLQAADAAARLNDKGLLQEALFGLGNAQSDLNDWVGALDSIQRAYDALPDPKGRARVRYANLRGRVYQELRQREASLEAYQEGIALATALKDDDLLGSLHNEIGLVYYRFDRNIPLALSHYDRAIQFFTRAGDHRGVMVVMNNSGNIFREPGTYQEAERRYRLGLAAAERAGIDGDAMLLKNMGVVYRETGRVKEAEATLQRAVLLADTRGNGRIQWQGRMELGTFYRESNPERATDYFEQTLRVLEAQNNNVLLEGFRAGALSGAVTIYDDPYDLYTDFLMNHGRERDAFFVAERARARAFLDTLTAAREEIASALPESFVRDERNLLEAISGNQARLRAPDMDATQRPVLQAAIREDEDRLTTIRVRLATEYPALANARYPKIFGVDEVQKQLLQKDEVLLQYFLGAKSGTLWAITQTGLHVRRLPQRSEVESQVREFLEALSKPETDVTAAGTRLGATLLPDLEPVIAGSRLLVVPNGILNYVPFEALIGTNRKFVVEEHGVSYAPSTSSLAFLRSRKATGTEVIAVGNPMMLAPGAATDRGAALQRVSALKPLLHSGPEVRAVGSLYGTTAHVFEQMSATEATLADAAASRAGIIHIATHGLIDEEMPERSGLALTAAPPVSDGILQMREIYNLHLNASLVTLSACQTALGRAVTGEGIVGISRAFFYAGSNAVLASLWNVNDASTERLMRPFYGALAGGQAIDDSLRTAKLALLKEGGRLSHPYYWAAFIVTGHGVATVPVHPQSSGTAWLAGLGVVALLGAAALVWRRVR